MTFLFTDLESSTRLWEQHPDAMKPALARHDEILRQAIEARAGHVVKTTGDGVHAVFGSAEAAVDAAMDAQRLLAMEDWSDPGPLKVRMGLHTGSAELRDGDYYGPTLNRGARVMAVAHGEQILVTQATADLIRDSLAAGVSVEDLGEHQLRDLSRPERVFQLCAPGLGAEFPPLRSLDAFPGNLPVQLTSFVGRDEELVEITKVLATARLVTIIGVGGVGKTRLAAQAAAEVLPGFEDGAWFSELAAVTDSESLSEVVASTLGVQARPGLSLADSVVEFLRPKQLLLVLDNCEHLLDATGHLAVAILRQCPRVRVLVTSREGLGVPGEQMWALRSLSLPPDSSSLAAMADSDAVRLFLERACSARPGFRLEEANATAVLEICRRLDGMPLAIELAAARVAAMNPADIAARLDERFRLLTGGRRAAVERHQTLLATLEWSYSLLEPRERLLFDRLGIFAGGFDPNAAEIAVSGEGLEAWDVLDGLGELVAKSMLSIEDSATGSVRYQLLETLREYARRRLEESDDADRWRRRHAEYYVAFAEQVRDGVDGPAELEWTSRFRAELDNLRAAVGWSLDSEDRDDVKFGLHVIGVLGNISTADGPQHSGPWAERALPRLDDADPGLASAILAVAAMYAFARGDIDAMRDRAHASLRLGPSREWPQPLGHVALALDAVIAGNLDQSVTAFEDAVSFLDSVGASPALRGSVRGGLSTFAAFAGQDDLSRDQANQALVLARESQSPSALAQALAAVGYSYRNDDPAVADAAAEESIALMHSGAALAVLIPTLGVAARLRARRGDRLGALQALREATGECRDRGDRPSLISLFNRGAVPVLTELGYTEAAAVLAGVVTSGTLSALSLFGADRQEREQAIERLKRELAPEAYEVASGRGAALSYEDMIEYTLSEVDRIIDTEAAAARERTIGT